MKYLNTYKLFESQNSGSGNTSFNWLKKQNNENYFELINILQSEILDDYKIYGKRDESFASDDDNDWPKYKFWAFRLENARSTDDDFSEFSDLKPEDEIASVTIYNVQEGEKDEIFDLLLEIRGRVRGYLNKEMVIFQETVVGGEYDVVTDILIKLEDIEDKLKESSNWSAEEIIKELTLELQDAGLQVKINVGEYQSSSVSFSNKDGLHIEITDKDKIFCKNYPEDDSDWLYGKPIIVNFINELTDFGFERDKDYKVYGGGLRVNIVFEDKGVIKL